MTTESILILLFFIAAIWMLLVVVMLLAIGNSDKPERAGKVLYYLTFCIDKRLKNLY